jgi:hypothetical protein
VCGVAPAVLSEPLRALPARYSATLHAHVDQALATEQRPAPLLGLVAPRLMPSMAKQRVTSRSGRGVDGTDHDADWGGGADGGTPWVDAVAGARQAGAARTATTGSGAASRPGKASAGVGAGSGLLPAPQLLLTGFCTKDGAALVVPASMVQPSAGTSTPQPQAALAQPPTYLGLRRSFSTGCGLSAASSMGRGAPASAPPVPALQQPAAGALNLWGRAAAPAPSPAHTATTGSTYFLDVSSSEEEGTGVAAQHRGRGSRLRTSLDARRAAATFVSPYTLLGNYGSAPTVPQPADDSYLSGSLGGAASGAAGGAATAPVRAHL